MIKPLTPEELGILFQEIEFEPTSKLSELAKVAELNLAIDYVGVDLSGDCLRKTLQVLMLIYVFGACIGY